MVRASDIESRIPALRVGEILRKHLLPHLQMAGFCPLTLAEPPFYLSPGVTVRFNAGKPLSLKQAQKGFYNGATYSWEECSVHMTEFPYLGYVVSGETDWRIGITQKMARQQHKQYQKSTFATLTIPQNNFFLMPAGVPYSNLPPITDKTPGNLRIMWIRFHRLGMQYHLSSILESGRYYGEPDLYLPDSHAVSLVEILMEELHQNHPSQEMMRSLLLSIMLRFQRGLQDPLNQESVFVSQPSVSEHESTGIVAEAISYIEANFRHQLTTSDIAKHVYCSSSYLRRIFQQEKGVSVTEYLTQFRVNYACTLLRDTSLNISHVGRTVGFRNHSSFCQIFQRRIGCSPSAYKRSI